MLGELEIRELVAGGADHLVALFAAVLPDFPTASLEELDETEAFLQEPGSFVLGAYVNGAPVGLVLGLQMRSPSGRLTTYLHEMAVHENHRCQGVGSTLVTEAMNLARARGSTKFWLSTGGHDETAPNRSDRKRLGDVNYWWDLSGLAEGEPDRPASPPARSGNAGTTDLPVQRSLARTGRTPPGERCSG